MYGETHATDGVPDPRSEMQLALCGVRFQQDHIDNDAPSCRWCKERRQQRTLTADVWNDDIQHNINALRAAIRGTLDRRRTT